MNIMWREVIRDLRSKVERFGLEHISALEGLPPIEEPASLTKVQDRDLLRACYRLGILDLESLIKLTNGWLLVTFHDTPGANPPDRLEFVNFIKHCIKHCLSVEGKHPPEEEAMLPEELRARRVERASRSSWKPTMVSTTSRTRSSRHESSSNSPSRSRRARGRATLKRSFCASSATPTAPATRRSHT